MNAREKAMQEKAKGLIADGQFTEARRSCERLLAHTIKAKGKRHPDTALAHRMLGQSLMGLNRHKEAAACLKKAIAILELCGMHEDARTADCLILLGAAKEASGAEETDVLTHIARAADIRKGILSPNNPGMAEVLAGIVVRTTTGDLEQAANESANAAIEMAQRLYGTGYLACMAIGGLVNSKELETRERAYSTVAPGKEVAFKRDTAVLLYRWLIDRYSILFGPYNEQLLEPLEGIASLCEARGDTDMTVAALEWIKSIKERLSGLCTRDHLEHLESLDRLYEKANDRPKQIEVLKERLALEQEENLNDNEFIIADIADRLGTAYLASDNYSSAFAWFKRAAAFCSDDEAERMDAVLYRFHLGNAYEEHGIHVQRGSYRKALVIYRDVLGKAREWLEPNDAMLAHILSAMGNVLSVLRAYGEAVRSHKEALKIRKTAEGDDSLVADSLNDMALVHIAAGNNRVARRLLQRTLVIAEKSFGTNHVNLTPMLNSLGLACAGCKAYKHAVGHLRRAVMIIEDTFGAQSINLVEQLENLGDVLAMAGHQKDAEAAYRRALDISCKKEGVEAPQTKELESCLANLASNKPSVSVDQMWTLPSDPQWRLEPDAMAKPEAVFGKAKGAI